MLIKITDKNNQEFLIGPKYINGFWIDQENLANVILQLPEEQLTVACKGEVSAKMLCRAIEESIQQKDGTIIDTAKLIEKYRQEAIDDVIKNGHFQNADTAKMTGEVQIDYPKDSKESVWFFLRDAMHDFKIGLSDIISALKFSEENGYIPSLPEQWWDKMEKIYPEIFEDDDVSGRVQSCENSKSNHLED